MKNIFIINGHQKYPFSEGKLNTTLVERLEGKLLAEGYNVKKTTMDETYDVEEEIEKHKWADVIFLQTPVNWMGVSWSFKKYMDEVYTAGMMGRMSDGDGRSAAAPKKNYGMGGLLKGKYMISITANAPREAFNNPEEAFFQGMSEDELFRPMHLNFKWFGLTPLKTFFAYDVMKNPEIDSDLQRFDKHISQELLAPA